MSEKLTDHEKEELVIKLAMLCGYLLVDASNSSDESHKIELMNEYNNTRQLIKELGIN